MGAGSGGPNVVEFALNKRVVFRVSNKQFDTTDKPLNFLFII
jgi:hypothetical protein